MIKPMKTVLVTGASSGIGKSLAKEFQAQGYQVYAGSRRIDQMNDLKELGVKVYQLDITSDESIESLKQTLASELNGKLDILYNNAGVTFRYPAVETSMQKIQELYNVNVFGAMNMNSAFAPWVVASKGKIVYASTGIVDVPLPWLGIYTSTKAAMRSYHNSLRLEMDPLGVSVVDVVIGMVGTEMTNTKPPVIDLPYDSLFRLAEPSLNIANTAGYNLESPDEFARYVVGQLRRSGNSKIYAGSQISQIRFLSMLPKTLRDMAVENTFNFSAYRKLVKESKQE